jgi:hypothetical protein
MALHGGEGVVGACEHVKGSAVWGLVVSRRPPRDTENMQA